MKKDFIRVLEHYGAKGLLSLSEQEISEIEKALRAVKDSWAQLGRESVESKSIEKLNEYKKYRPQISADLLYYFELKTGSHEEIEFWRILVNDLPLHESELHSKKMIQNHISKICQKSTNSYEPKQLIIIKALNSVSPQAVEKSLRFNLANISPQLYVALRKENILPPELDTEYPKKIVGSMIDMNLFALQDFYTHFKSSYLSGHQNFIKYEFLYATFLKSAPFFQEVLSQLNNELTPTQKKLTLQTIIEKSKHNKVASGFSIKNLSDVSFEYGLNERWFVKSHLFSCFDSPPHFKRILDKYGKDRDIMTNIEILLNKTKHVGAKALYEKHLLSLHMALTQNTKIVDKPTFKV